MAPEYRVHHLHKQIEECEKKMLADGQSVAWDYLRSVEYGEPSETTLGLAQQHFRLYELCRKLRCEIELLGIGASTATEQITAPDRLQAQSPTGPSPSGGG